MSPSLSVTEESVEALGPESKLDRELKSPTSPTFENARLSAATGNNYGYLNNNISPSKVHLMQQLNIDGIGDQSVHIYDSGGLRFKVNETDLYHEIRSAKQANKQSLQSEILDRVQELENSFSKRADLIQQAVEKETENANSIQ